MVNSVINIGILMQKIFDFPKIIINIFEKLNNNGYRPIVVGGFVRDKIMGHIHMPKDMDIEVYGLEKIENLVEFLSEFGSVNLVGKSFGVLKLRIDSMEIDLSLPRLEHKSAKGHKGFIVSLEPSLSFSHAARRRDFTINAIGYDYFADRILDPFEGQKDIDEKLLRCVDPNTFIEDPLRVLRAVQFAARFSLSLDEGLERLCKEMIKNDLLDELPKERIFEEIKKLLLQSPKPSYGFELLKALGGQRFFAELFASEDLVERLANLDAAAKISQGEPQKLALLMAILTFSMPVDLKESFLSRLFDDKRLFLWITTLHGAIEKARFARNDYDIYTLAQHHEIAFLEYLREILIENKQSVFLSSRAKELGVFHEPLKPLIMGKELIEAGLIPSSEFSKLIQSLYEAQKKGLINSKEEALIWMRENLLS